MVSTPENPDPTQMMGVGSFTAGASVVGDDPNKKIRKPYTITKSRESWTDPEHDKFLEALQLFDRDWKKIEAFVGSKSVIQIRSHAQKYFLKAQKSGAGEHLPPPRPKRKAAHPYPQKASKNVPVIPQVAASFQPSPVLSEPVFMRRPDPSPVVRASVANTGLSHPADQFVPTGGIPHATKVSGDIRPSGRVLANNCCSSSESTPRTWPAGGKLDQDIHSSSLRVLPDFAQVYGFIGSVFDPCTTDHLQNLKKMDAIDVETVLLLMRNLSVNLTSPDFDEHKRLLSSYEIDSDKNESSGLINNSSDDQSGVAEHYV